MITCQLSCTTDFVTALKIKSDYAESVFSYTFSKYYLKTKAINNDNFSLTEVAM